MFKDHNLSGIKYLLKIIYFNYLPALGLYFLYLLGFFAIACLQPYTQMVQQISVEGDGYSLPSWQPENTLDLQMLNQLCKH